MCGARYNIDIAAISKEYNGQKIYLLYNLSETDEKKVELSKSEYGYKEIAGYLSVDGGEVKLSGDTITMPAYSRATVPLAISGF